MRTTPQTTTPEPIAERLITSGKIDGTNFIHATIYMSGIDDETLQKVKDHLDRDFPVLEKKA
jgi:hypothetical protein